MKMSLCASCRSPAEHRCSRCKSARYCGRQCQAADWAAHRPVCLSIWERLFGPSAETLERYEAALRRGDLAEMRRIDPGGALVNFRFYGEDPGFTPLMYAASYDYRPIARYLLASGADVQGTDENGSTALHYASSKKMVRLLVARGADVSARNLEDYTPLGHAITEGTDVVAALLEAGADINEPQAIGNTALHWAINAGDDFREMALFLIERTPPKTLTTKNNAGDTPLHRAAAERARDVALALMSTGDGAEALAMRNNLDETPRDLWPELPVPGRGISREIKFY